MAETAANYYLTSETNPSIFEIIAQKSLNVTLEPALRKVAEFLAASSPNRFGWLNKYYDETFMALNGLLQYHYLKNHSASFAEYFYGLKRIRLDDYEITKCEKIMSWSILVILPYLKSKLEEKLQDYRLGIAEQSIPNNNFKGKLIRTLILAHSGYEATWGSWVLINYLRYMSNIEESQLPALKLLQLKLIYSDVENDFHSFWSSLLKGQMSFSELSVGLAQNAVRSTLEISAFFVQFLQAWNKEKANFSITALPSIPPPELDSKAKNYKEKCPICLQTWKVPTVLPVSGYVFCFSCIINHLRENGTCPVTNYPAKAKDVIRLY
ncbi:PREDICTED: peroxisome assembly protein 12 [Nicrophorus vespilloides]|uniref:Peroxisome assembly protein 12 n=1 Tax=Nicrophorus vespilloides TaxID=110193 RepID=A0ABM1M9W8_NICVS|nr:PREDICTED: peroxisome assembly protein 12 [Nicrophorus vespilloides]